MAICVPPGAPSTTSSWPSPSNVMVGQDEVKRLLPGRMLPARPGRGSNTPMQPL